MMQPTTARPNNDYTQADLDAEASEEVTPEPGINYRLGWPLFLGALAIPVGVVIGMLWAVGAL